MKIVCLGSGNVATHLAVAFRKAGIEIAQVWSRNMVHAAELATAVDSTPIDDLGAVDQSAYMYLIAVKDDAIESVAAALKGVNGLVVHTSGATSIEVLKEFKNSGVLYPLQTFSKGKVLDLTKCPFCLEANSAAAYLILEKTASAISSALHKVDSAQRKTLHLAAVFACNFSNHLYHLANTILAANNLQFDLLRPLIMETALKVQDDLPVRVQTGPAIRNDESTMNDHIKLLSGSPELQELYESLSKSIKKTG
jgi:predicted short-subunit dehydrogenase-like oxidoreductase (DUF2520 family)